eukprot:m.766663 g.766663  ORF g.766663 m.766663 type:complete len:79 (+) comp59065_c0_seq34:994-1230(+)
MHLLHRPPYWHAEVIRTRLREKTEGDAVRKYRGFFQSGKVILREEGFRGLYSGLTAHLARVVPNAAILLLLPTTIAYR